VITELNAYFWEVSLAESLHRKAKVLLPRFHLETAALRPVSLPLIFSRSKPLIWHKMAPEASYGPHKASGRIWGVSIPFALWAAGGPLWYIFAPLFFIYSIKNLCEVSGHLELCRIGISAVAFSGPEFQQLVISLSM
jgi:hypothetical protein